MQIRANPKNVSYETKFKTERKMTLDYSLFIFLGIVFAVGIIAFLFYAYKK